MRSFRLSKSRFTAGLQCGKRLWLVVHRPEREVYSADAGRRFTVSSRIAQETLWAWFASLTDSPRPDQLRRPY